MQQPFPIKLVERRQEFAAGQIAKNAKYSEITSHVISSWHGIFLLHFISAFQKNFFFFSRKFF
jgi:hypothetical protein